MEIKIKEYECENGRIAHFVKCYTSFYYLSLNFEIFVFFLDENSSQILETQLNVDDKVVNEWMETAKLHPEKATFLNFRIIFEWACQQLNIVPIDENT